jgi:hypothetical protein
MAGLVRRLSASNSVGLHPSWGSGDRPARLAEEKERLESLAGGSVSHIDLWMEAEGEPCEVRFGPPEADAPRGLPTRLDVARGGEPFGTFLVEPTEEQP